MTEKPSVEAVFVVGCPRSGTSLMRNLLNLDPQVAVAPETHFLDQWLPKVTRIADPEARTRALWGQFRTSPHFTKLGLDETDVDLLGRQTSPRDLFAEMIRAYGRKQGAAFPGEKTPAHFRYVDTLLDWFPDGRIVFLVRDPRSVVASLQALDAEWAQGSLTQHVHQWSDAAAAAQRWQVHPRVAVLRYEEFVADTTGVMSDLFETVLGRRFQTGWLDGRASSQTSALSNGSVRATSAVTSGRVQAWRERLGRDQIAVIEHRAADLMLSLGYEVESPRPDAQARLLAGRERSSELFRRAVRATRDPLNAMARMRYRRSGGAR